jgi:iron-sulfur cluster assembly protein
MALDEPKDDDEIMDNNGITYLMNKQLLDQVKPVTVDFVESATVPAFPLSSSLAKGNSCGSCSPAKEPTAAFVRNAGAAFFS